MSRFISIKKGEFDRAINRTYRLYKSGLLREERKLTGPILGTNFTSDFSYLVMIFSGLYRLTNVVPARRQKSVVINKATVYAANIDIILSYLLQKRKMIKSPTLVGKRAYKVALMYYPKKAAVFEELIDDYLYNIEAYNREPEMMAQVVGNLFSEVLNWRDDDYSEDLKAMGYYFGKYYYYFSSYKTLRRDEKKGYYNPLIFTKKKDPESFETYIRQTLKSQLSACKNAFDKLPIKENAPIIGNAMYAGIWGKMDL